MAFKFTSVASVFLLLAAVIFTTPVRSADPKCGSVGVRKEWRRLTTTEQDAYLDAVQCLTNLPSKHTYPQDKGEFSRFEDFVATHIQMTPVIHFDGQFLPWHRYFVQFYETTLRNECGYKGSQPFWDWTLDRPPANMTQSPVFQAQHGFGGNGIYVPLSLNSSGFGAGFPLPPASEFKGGSPSEVKKMQSLFATFAKPAAPTATATPPPGSSMPMPDPTMAGMHTGGGCITDGPFKNLTLHLGPGAVTASNPRCLNRDFAPAMLTQATPQAIDYALIARTFAELQITISNLHSLGHGAVGGITGEIGNLFSSANDPLFYMHHTNLDRVWWSWQKLNLTARLIDISGSSDPMKYDKIGLDFVLQLGNLGNTTVQNVMDIGSYPMCADYDEVYTFQ